jgi:membrane-associated protease RseP (regulator of RpoE activity)
MSFIIYDLSFLVLFTLAIVIFLYTRKHNLKREGLMYLYRTKIGLKFIDYIAKKYPKTLKVMSYIIIACGYALMVMSVYFLFQILNIFTKPELVKIIKVPPIMPLIPYMGEIFKASWLPPFYFTYWIIAIALVAIFHEGAHGVFARFNKIRIKSTGFGFLGPFLAFFVEQDDKQMQKAKIFPQLTILAAGVFANVILTIIFFLLLGGFFSMAYAPSGAIFSDYSYAALPAGLLGSVGIMNETINVNGNNLTKISFEGKNYFIHNQIFAENISDPNSYLKIYQDQGAIRNGLKGYITEIDGLKIKIGEDISKVIAGKKVGERISIKTKLGNETYSYSFNLGADYNNQTRPVIGIATSASSSGSHSLRAWITKLVNRFNDPSVHYEPKIDGDFTTFVYYLLWWIFMINLSVAVANMLPLGIFDGGRFFMLTILAITGKEKWAENSFKWVTWFLLGIILIMMVLYFIGIF